MKRAVFDTNVLLSALLATSGVSAHLLTHSEHFTLITSEATLAELAEKSPLPRIQGKYYLTDAVISEYLTRLRAAAIVVDVHSNVISFKDNFTHLDCFNSNNLDS
jgi:putative PIN family toxin of toxin-antitoxin system